MSVQSLAFLAFLTVTVCVCRLLPKERTWVLLAASLVFYLWGGAPSALWGCGLLAVSSFVSYLAANTLRKHRRKSVLLAVVCYHIAVLGIFKYTVFFTGGAVRMPFVPLGISFFTFQQIWYLREVYAGTFSQVPTPAEYLTYSFFFPTVSSGPILKPGNFFPQLRETSPLPQDTAAGLYAIGLGLAKKVLLADNLGVLVNNGWGSLSELTALTAWCVILGYTLQLYFDFSGYCDLTAGCARLLGLRLPINFDSPYRSLSVTEFWKRWHMTLTAFLRENVYFPLGGSRKGRGRTYLNILVVYLVSGIWHGAGGTFILWGLLHGLAQVLERLWGKRRDALPRWVRWAMTFLFINLAWVFFRAPDVSSALLLLKTAVTGGMGGIRLWLVNGLFRREVSALELLLPVIGPYTAYLRVALILGIGLLAALWPRNVIRQMDTFRPNWRSGLYVLVWTVWAILSTPALLKKGGPAMEQRAYQKWTRGLLLGLVLVLTACAAVVYRVDPCFYYRMPTDREPVFFSERYQTAGIVRNNPADVVLLGSSMTANCYGSQLETVFGGTGLRLTIPDGYFSEFDQVMGLLMRTHPPKRVLFAMDTNIFTRSPDGVTGAMPDYLYDSSTINDVKYLLNKDVLYYSLYALMAQRWDEGETLDKGFSWMDTVWWNHMTALEEYTRPDIAPEPMPRDGLLADAAKNLAVAASWAERYPEVEFDFYFSPYSILYWDKIGRMGETDAVFAALELACETLLPYENVTLHGLLFDRDIIEHLDYYCDYVHHSDEAGALALEKIHSGTDRLTEKNYRETLANWHDFVVNYDYDKFWDDYYWYQFHTPAGAKT